MFESSFDPFLGGFSSPQLFSQAKGRRNKVQVRSVPPASQLDLRAEAWVPSHDDLWQLNARRLVSVVMAAIFSCQLGLTARV